MATEFNRRLAEIRTPMLIIGAFAGLFSPSAVLAETPAVCHGYAEKAVNSFRENQSRDCRYANARWHDNFDAHYNWCLAAPNVWVRDEQEFRDNLLRACQGEHKAVECKKYAFMASSSQASNLGGNCGFTGGRWQDNEDQHMRWCMGTNNWDVVNGENNIRFALLGVCSRQEPYVRCDAYARSATEQGDEARRRNCGFSGPRWTATYEQHLTWCIDQDAAVAESERRNREGPLSQCRTTHPLGPPPPDPEACLWTTVVTIGQCAHNDGSPDTLITPGSRTVPGCGGTEELSVERAKIAMMATDLCLSEGDEPEAGCCTYTKQSFQGCECR